MEHSLAAPDSVIVVLIDIDVVEQNVALLLMDDVCDAEAVEDEDVVAVDEALNDIDGDEVAVDEADKEGIDAVADKEGEDDTDPVAVALGDTDGSAESLGASVFVGDADGLPELMYDDDTALDTVAFSVTERAGESDGLELRDTVPERDLRGEPLKVAEREGALDAVAHPDAEGDDVSDSDAEVDAHDETEGLVVTLEVMFGDFDTDEEAEFEDEAEKLCPENVAFALADGADESDGDAEKLILEGDDDADEVALETKETVLTAEALAEIDALLDDVVDTL